MALWVVITMTQTAYAAFVDNGNGTVSDTRSGLMWQQDTARDAGGNYDAMTWKEALAHCANLELPLGGYTDWRLPTIKELRSLVDYSQYSPSINRNAFPDTVSSYYWSSTTYANGTSYAWYVYFNGGYGGTYGKSNGSYVRAVRGGQSGAFGSLDHLVISVPAGAQSVGDDFTITVTAEDAAGLQVLDFAGSVNLSAEGNTVDPTAVTLSGGHGSASIRILNVGKTRLNCDGYGAYGNSRYFDVAGENPCIGSIEGSVVDCRGTRVSQATVRARDVEGDVMASTTTDGNGRFTLADLTCGPYDIEVEKSGKTATGIWKTVGGHYCTTAFGIELPLNCGTEQAVVVLVPGIMGSSESSWGGGSQLAGRCTGTRFGFAHSCRGDNRF